MDRKIGEVFKYRDNSVTVVESSKGSHRCSDCDFYKTACWKLEKETGACNDLNRRDGKNVVFKIVKK